MDCLIDYIGLKGCTATTPDSGLYINSLPGVNLKKIDDAADDQQVNFDGVWDDVQLRAARRFRSDVIAAMGQNYTLKRLARTLNLQRVADTATTTAPSAQYRGFSYELNEADDDIVDSNLQTIHLQSVGVYMTSSGTLDFVIYDLETSELLYSVKTATLAEGWNTVNFEKKYLDSKRIFVGYDATGVTSVKLDPDLADDYFECCKGRIQGGYSATATPTVVTDIANTYGLAPILNVRCEWDALVCGNKDLFVNAWWYLLGAELMSEIMMSDRLNRWTTVNRTQIEQQKAIFETQYRGGVVVIGDTEVTFDGLLPNAIKGVYINQNDCCVECSNQYTFNDGV